MADVCAGFSGLSWLILVAVVVVVALPFNCGIEMSFCSEE